MKHSLLNEIFMMKILLKLCLTRISTVALIGLSGLITGCANVTPSSTSVDADLASKIDPNESSGNSESVELAAEEPPFFGDRYFNFYGGNGTGQSITIELDGATTVEQHGTESSSVLYRGQFSNPLILDDGERLRIEGNTISKISEDGDIISGCNGEGEPCESELYDATTSPPILDGLYVLGGTDQGLEVFGDQYRYYDEMGEKEWNPLVELTYIQQGVIFDGENYWCLPRPDEAGVCTENGWRSVEESLSEQSN
ncbi:hypothetical protein [Phormidium tenue]|uniref:hypothetical protein n=1 Tax=Phormidium tenue TaxID=126344 RepID=UPI001684FA2F|nr:hypothetical protein [Phormidium tenue]MBD2232748.1 hypothetical protein [Phormidium tenue FACHB-1052]